MKKLIITLKESVVSNLLLTSIIRKLNFLAKSKSCEKLKKKCFDNFLLMKRHYLYVTKLSILFRNIKHHVDFFCFNCPLSFRAKKTHNSDENICKYHKHCKTVMPTNENNILKCYHDQKSIKVPFAIYIGFEIVLEKSSTCYVNLETLYTSESNKHTCLVV